MREHKGDLWTLAGSLDADAVAITTNGDVLRDGSCVMGKGCAGEAQRRWPKIQQVLGEAILAHGNHVYDLGMWDGIRVFSFPVKQHWREAARPGLIKRSAHELANLVRALRLDRVLVPRPGCGNGQLQWQDVEPLLLPIWDNRFVIVSHPEEA